MTDDQLFILIDELLEAANDLYLDHDLGFPQTYEDFERAMWQDDTHMNQWEVTREDYTNAMRVAYRMLS